MDLTLPTYMATAKRFCQRESGDDYLAFHYTGQVNQAGMQAGGKGSCNRSGS
jgi:hypothetical protein